MTLETRPRRTEVAPGASPGRSAVHRLCLVLLLLTAAATLTGLLRGEGYAGPEATRAMLRGYDLVTLLVAVPALTGATVLARHGATLPRVLRTGLLAFWVYNYAYYLFGTGFGDLFLLHIGVFSTALVALVLDVASSDPASLRKTLGRAPVRPVAVVLAVLSVALAAMWVWVTVDNAVTGSIPAGSRLVETPTIVHLGIALDLALLVPWYGAAAVLLWRDAPWGYLLAATALVSGLLHQVSYLVALPFQVAADVPAAASTDPAEPVIVVLYLVGAVLLLQAALRRRRAAPGR